MSASGDRRSEIADTAAAQLAWWWRMTQTDDMDDPRGEASWWKGPALHVVDRLLAEDYLRTEENT